MKKKLRMILITSLLMIIGMGAFLWRMNGLAKKENAKMEKLLDEERDLVADSGNKITDEIKEVDIIPLYLSGDDKNVITTSVQQPTDVYNPAKSAEVEEMLTDIRKNKEFSFSSPLWAYNPYGTNRLSMYLYFKSEGRAYCRYTVTVKEPDVPDFTRTFLNDGKDNLSKEHEYQLIGLIPGKKNFITLQLYNRKNQLSAKQTYSIDVPAVTDGAQTKLDVETGYSKTKVSNGLYTLFAGARMGADGKPQYAMLQYDNSGFLRSDIPLLGDAARNMQMIYDTLVYASGPNQIVKVNDLGQVTDAYGISAYRITGEYAYDGSASIYLIATKDGKKQTKSSKILKLELETKEVTEALDLDTLMPKVRKKNKGKNWVDVNSIQVVGTNQLLISSAGLSSIFKVSQVSSLLPKVDYIIGDPALWKDYKNYQKKVLAKDTGEEENADASGGNGGGDNAKQEDNSSKKKDFAYQYGQNSMSYQKKSGEGQYYLEFLNNNAGKGAGTGGQSYYYRYQVDETARTYQLKFSKDLAKVAADGNVIVEDDVIIFCNSDAHLLQETDTKGKLIRQFTCPDRVYRAYKSDWKGFWFY